MQVWPPPSCCDPNSSIKRRSCPQLLNSSQTVQSLLFEDPTNNNSSVGSCYCRPGCQYEVSGRRRQKFLEVVDGISGQTDEDGSKPRSLSLMRLAVPAASQLRCCRRPSISTATPGFTTTPMTFGLPCCLTESRATCPLACCPAPESPLPACRVRARHQVRTRRYSASRTIADPIRRVLDDDVRVQVPALPRAWNARDCSGSCLERGRHALQIICRTVLWLLLSLKLTQDHPSVTQPSWRSFGSICSATRAGTPFWVHSIGRQQMSCPAEPSSALDARPNTLEPRLRRTMLECRVFEDPLPYITAGDEAGTTGNQRGHCKFVST